MTFSLFLYTPVIIPTVQTQILPNESIRKKFTKSFDTWTTDKKSVNTGSDYQTDMRSASNLNSALEPIAVHQTTERKKSFKTTKPP